VGLQTQVTGAPFLDDFFIRNCPASNFDFDFFISQNFDHPSFSSIVVKLHSQSDRMTGHIFGQI